jgi:methylmalonyl-CoA mutase cobalamin-binding subunit
MDDRKPPISQSAHCGKADADAALIDSVRQGSSVVYFCGAGEVSEGFAIALRAMGFDEILLPDIVAQSPTTSNPEDS